MSENGINHDYLSHRLLRVLSERLNAYGMQTRESRHGEEIVEIAATNPRDPDKGGRVVIGYEGYLVWECWTEFKSDSDAITAADVVYALLTQDLTAAARQSQSGCVLPETPARVAVDSARAGPSPKKQIRRKPVRRTQ
jgi:hypothetical protein